MTAVVVKTQFFRNVPLHVVVVTCRSFEETQCIRFQWQAVLGETFLVILNCFNLSHIFENCFSLLDCYAASSGK